MHELSIAMSIADLVREAIAGEIPEEIELEIGELAGIEIDSLLFSLDAVLKHDFPGDIRVTVNRIAPLSACTVCGAEFVPENIYSPCPCCQSHRVTFKQGRELRLKSVVVV